MIQAVFYRDAQDIFRGFRISGHAGYGEYGQDIVCAAVSALALTAVNSIEAFCSDRFTAQERDGDLDFRLVSAGDSGSQLLLKSLALGVEQIRQEYGSKYIKVRYRMEEV